MKKLLTFITGFFFFSLTVCGQTTAIDWTKADCPGNNHNLYSYLNNEEVVIMEFAMGCSSCTNAATYLLNTKDKYAISNPGKVNVFYMDYWAGNDCVTNIIATTSPYAFDAVFEHCLYEKNDYFTSAGSPMPGIVIAAGSFHQIIYQENSFSLADTLLMEQAITTFFATAGVNENLISRSISISPNPSTGELLINFFNTETQKTKISLYNIKGQLISELFNEAFQTGEIQKKTDISSYPKGIYYINITNTKESINTKIIVL